MDDGRRRPRVGIVFLDTSVVNLALPRIGEDLPSRPVRHARGAVLRRQRLLRHAERAADPGRRRSPTTTAAARCSRSAWSGSPTTSLLCGLAPTMEFLIVGADPAGRRRCLRGAGLARRSSPRPSRARSRAARSASGRAPPPRRRSSGRSSAACSSTRSRGAWRSWSTFRSWLIAYVATIRYVPESRDDRRHRTLRLARLARGRAGGRRPRVRHDPRPAAGMDASRSPSASLAVGALAAIAFPFMMVHRRDPARATAPLPIAELHRDQHLDARDLRRALRLAHVPGDLPDRHARLQRAGRRASRASRLRCSSCCSPRGSGSWRRGTARGCS